MRLRSWFWVCWLPLACTSGTDEGSAFGDNSGPVGTSVTATSTGDPSGGTTDAPGSSGDDPGSTGLTVATTQPPTSTTEAGTGGDTAGVTTSACMGAPTGVAALGETCTEGCECSSGICFGHALLGFACSECLTDAECQTAGVGTCSLNPATESAACTAGELGVMCDPAATGCAAGLTCEQLIDTGGVLPDTFCSECATAADCAAGETCTPEVLIDGVQPGGFLHCVPLGSGADGTFCPSTGDASSCASGICAVVDVGGLGIAEVGVCGPCASDEDCPGTCQPPVVSEDGAVPSLCI